MAEFNLPFGIYRSTRGDLDLRFRVLNDTERDLLITNDLVDIGHIIYNVSENKHYRLKTYPSYKSLSGIEWDLLSNDDSLLASNNLSDLENVLTARTNIGLTKPVIDALGINATQLGGLDLPKFARTDDVNQNIDGLKTFFKEVTFNSTATFKNGRSIIEASTNTFPIIQLKNLRDLITWNIENSRSTDGSIGFYLAGTGGGDRFKIHNNGDIEPFGNYLNLPPLLISNSVDVTKQTIDISLGDKLKLNEADFDLEDPSGVISILPKPSVSEYVIEGTTLKYFAKPVVIPDGVTIVDDFAFINKEVTSLTIPNSVISIGNESFGGNRIEILNIPNSVTSISLAAFSINLINTLTIPNSITTIEDSVFRDNKITSLTIPNSVTSIGSRSFIDNLLTDVSLPAGCTYYSNSFDPSVTITGGILI